RKTMLNRTHCNSSQAFDDRSKTLRTVAFTADTRMATRTIRANARPTRRLIASMTRLTLSSRRMCGLLLRSPGGRQGDGPHHSWLPCAAPLCAAVALQPKMELRRALELNLNCPLSANRKKA